MDKCRLWEELLFGPTSIEQRVIEAFEGRVEHHSTPTTTLSAKKLLKEMIKERARKAINRPFQDRLTRIGVWLHKKVTDHVSSVPEHLLNEVEGHLYEELPDPDDLPVEWSNHVHTEAYS